MVETDATKPILSDVAGSCPVSHQHPLYVPTGGKMVVRPSCHTKDICTCVHIQRSGQSDGRSPWIAEPSADIGLFGDRLGRVGLANSCLF